MDASCRQRALVHMLVSGAGEAMCAGLPAHPVAQIASAIMKEMDGTMDERFLALG